jgi:hypothetical protein
VGIHLRSRSPSEGQIRHKFLEHGEINAFASAGSSSKMDPFFQDQRGYSEPGDFDDRMGGEPTPSESGDGRRRRRRHPRTFNRLPLNTEPHALRPGDEATNAAIMAFNGAFVTYPGFISRYWPQGFIAGWLADSLGLERIDLHRIRTEFTPRGCIDCRQAVVAWFRLGSRPNQTVLAWFLILEDQDYRHFGVPVIVGRPLLPCLGGQDCPLSQNIPVRTSVAAPEGTIHTFVEVFDPPSEGLCCHRVWQEATTTDSVNNWLANSDPIPQ